MPFGPQGNQSPGAPVTPRFRVRPNMMTRNASAPSPIAQFGPPGRWWDNQQFASSLGIDTVQKRHMDQVFSANRNTLLTRYLALKQEEAALDKMIRRGADEKRIDSQINRVAQARADLEKANTHMILELRRQLTEAQAKKAEELASH